MSTANTTPTTNINVGPLQVVPPPVPTITLQVTPPPGDSSVADAGTLNSVATNSQVRQLQTAALNAPLRLIYGRQMVGALLADVMVYGGNLVIFAVWCQGPVKLIESVYLDGVVAGAGVTVVNHDGTQVVPDPTLVAAYAAQSPGITYTDVLPGIAYSVIILSAAVTTGFPTLTAIVQGMKVYDPRDVTQTLGVPTTYKYSDNPALAIADLQTNATYGAGGAVDWTSVTTVANACDALVASTEKRRLIGLVIDQKQQIDTWFDAMRTYAGCFLWRNGGILTLAIDRPTSSTFTFSETTGNCRVKNVSRRSKKDLPTVVAIQYTDTSAAPWRDAYAYAYAAGVLAGTTPWRQSSVQMPGITRSSQANREAIEQLNKLAQTDLTLDIEAQDEALAVSVGDVVTVTANVGLSARQVRVINQATPGVARPVFTCEGYDPAVYSDSVVTTPSVVDTTLPNPNSPPQVTGLTLTEELFQVNASGAYLSRIKVAWTAPANFPVGFIRDYLIEVSLAGAIVDSSSATSSEYRTPALAENNTYLVKVWTRSATGALSASPTSASLLVTGTPPVPSDVANFQARSVGGRMFMTWSLNPEKNIAFYELRYGSTNVWGAGTLITRTQASGFIADVLPAGTWYFMIKAVSSAKTTANPDGTPSANAASQQVTLQFDTSLIVRATYLFTTPTLANMTAYNLQGDPATYYITDMGDGVGFGADNTNDTIGTFGDSLVNRVLAAPHTSGTSSWTSETFDYGSVLFGDWNFAGNITALDGSAITVTLNLKALIGDPWTPFTAFPGRMAARYAQLVISAATTNTLLIKKDVIGPAVTLDVAYKSESFTVTTSATLPVTVSLVGKYSLYKAIPMSPKGTAAKMAVYNNVVLSPSGANSFDVYAFNDAGVQVAVEVTGVFEGV